MRHCSAVLCNRVWAWKQQLYFWPVTSWTPSMLSRRTEVPCATATRPDIERVGTWSNDLHDSRGQIESIARQVQLCLDGYRATHTPSGCGDELLFCYVLSENVVMSCMITSSVITHSCLMDGSTLTLLSRVASSTAARRGPIGPQAMHHVLCRVI